MTVTARRRSTRIEIVLLRAVMVLMGAGTALVGASLITTPVAIPVVIGLWLGALGMFALGVWGRLPDQD